LRAASALYPETLNVNMCLARAAAATAIARAEPFAALGRPAAVEPASWSARAARFAPVRLAAEPASWSPQVPAPANSATGLALAVGPVDWKTQASLARVPLSALVSASTFLLQPLVLPRH
jgi:hypothetical protein